MPYLFKGISKHVPQYQAWRWAFFVPGAMHVLIALLILICGQVRTQISTNMDVSDQTLVH